MKNVDSKRLNSQLKSAFELGVSSSRSNNKDLDVRDMWRKPLSQQNLKTIVMSDIAGDVYAVAAQLSNGITSLNNKPLEFGFNAVPDFAMPNAYTTMSAMAISLASRGHKSTGHKETIAIKDDELHTGVTLGRAANRILENYSGDISEKNPALYAGSIILMRNQELADMMSCSIEDIRGGKAFQLDTPKLGATEYTWTPVPLISKE